MTSVPQGALPRQQGARPPLVTPMKLLIEPTLRIKLVITMVAVPLACLSIWSEVGGLISPVNREIGFVSSVCVYAHTERSDTTHQSGSSCFSAPLWPMCVYRGWRGGGLVWLLDFGLILTWLTVHHYISGSLSCGISFFRSYVSILSYVLFICSGSLFFFSCMASYRISFMFMCRVIFPFSCSCHRSCVLSCFLSVYRTWSCSCVSFILYFRFHFLFHLCFYSRYPFLLCFR